jgi:hypothetical protein
VFFQSGGAGSDIIVHSVDSGNGNPSAGEATVYWTAPVAGTINISGYLYDTQANAVTRSNDFSLSLGGTLLQSGTLGVVTSPVTLTSLSFTDLSVTAGEVLALVIFRSAGQQAGTETGFDLTVVETATPLPAALPLFATGLGGLGLLGWRKKRKAQIA